MQATHSIGIDLGGTNIKGGICDRGGRLTHKDALRTEADRGFEHVLGRMGELVDRLLRQSGKSREEIAGVGVGAPGPMSHSKGLIYGAPNLPGFVNQPLRDLLAERIAMRVVLENDANAAAFGEYAAGAGRDVRNMVMLTLGTGVGGGVVLDGHVWRGSFDNAGEVGHMIIVPDGRPCPCGQRGCLERYASANAVAERLREAVETGADSKLKPLVTAGEEFDARDVEVAMGAGDALARRIWEETCYYLALCAVNLRHLLNPEMIVLAGGLIRAGRLLLDPVREKFANLSWHIAPDAPTIALATLGTDAGTIGAAALVWEDVQ